jgi:hypothetical protein
MELVNTLEGSETLGVEDRFPFMDYLYPEGRCSSLL